MTYLVYFAKNYTLLSFIVITGEAILLGMSWWGGYVECY